MRFFVQRHDLLEALNVIGGVIPAKPALPVLSYLLIEAEGQSITISATDLVQSIRTTIKAKVDGSGTIALPARRFAQLVREITAAELLLESSFEKVQIKAGSACFALNTVPTADFPQFPSIEGSFSLTTKSQELHDLFYRVASSAAKDDSRMILNGVFLQVVDGSLIAVATDGKRLAKNTLAVPNRMDGQLSAVIPIKSIEEMVRLMGQDGQCTIFIAQDRVAIVTHFTTFVTKLLQGQYPDYEQIIPKKEKSAKVTLHKEELTSILRQVSLFTSDECSSVRFQFDSSELHLRASNQQIGDGACSMPIDYHGDSLAIAFNPYYALDILRYSKGETIEIELIDSYHQGVIRDKSEALFVLMPMRLGQ